MNNLQDFIKTFLIPRDVPINIAKSALELIFNIEVTGTELVPRTGGAIIVCNHTDNLDGFIQACYVPRRIIFLGKYELFNPQDELLQSINSKTSPFNVSPLSLVKKPIEDALNAFGDVYSAQMKHWGGIPIIRNYHGEDAKAALAYYEEIEEFMLQILRDGELLSIFPEGTRSTTGIMGSFKALAAKLAIKAGVPIIPAGISGAWNMSSPQAFISGQALGNTINFNIGVPIPPDQFPKEAEKKSAKLLTDELHKRVYFLTTHSERRTRSRKFTTVL